MIAGRIVFAERLRIEPRRATPQEKFDGMVALFSSLGVEQKKSATMPDDLISVDETELRTRNQQKIREALKES